MLSDIVRQFCAAKTLKKPTAHWGSEPLSYSLINPVTFPLVLPAGLKHVFPDSSLLTDTIESPATTLSAVTKLRITGFQRV